MGNETKNLLKSKGFVVVTNDDDGKTLRQIVEITKPKTMEEFQKWFYYEIGFQKLDGDEFVYFEKKADMRSFVQEFWNSDREEVGGKGEAK